MSIESDIDTNETKSLSELLACLHLYNIDSQRPVRWSQKFELKNLVAISEKLHEMLGPLDHDTSVPIANLKKFQFPFDKETPVQTIQLYNTYQNMISNVNFFLSLRL